MCGDSTLVIFGTSNILSDLLDCAAACGLARAIVVPHLAPADGARDVAPECRVAAAQRLIPTVLLPCFEAFRPAPGERYLLGPTTPARADLADAVQARFAAAFGRAATFGQLVHPRAYVSPLAALGPGVFVGANSVVAAGAVLGAHVFVNRGVTIGHDTEIGAFSRIQPGCNLGGLSRIGRGVTIGIGATLIERLAVGDGAFVAAGAVVTGDVAAATMVAGRPARFSRVAAAA